MQTIFLYILIHQGSIAVLKPLGFVKSQKPQRKPPHSARSSSPLPSSTNPNTKRSLKCAMSSSCTSEDLCRCRPRASGHYRSCCSPPHLQLCLLPLWKACCSWRWPPWMRQRPSQSSLSVCVEMEGGEVTPFLAIRRSPAWSPAAATTYTAGVFQHQEGGPAAWSCQPDTWEALLTLPVAAAPWGRPPLHLWAAAEGLLLLVVDGRGVGCRIDYQAGGVGVICCLTPNRNSRVGRVPLAWA